MPMPTMVWTSDEVEFEARFQQFVIEGGLDVVELMSEDYERIYRRLAFCKHRLIWNSCKECHVITPPYWPGY